MNFTKEQILANRKLWLNALKSGRYQKGEGMLCNYGKYCCLGVAAEIMGCEASHKTPFNAKKYKVFDGSDDIAPKRVVEGLGLRDSVGSSFNEKYCLAVINDTSDTFAPVIAALETGNYWIPEAEL